MDLTQELAKFVKQESCKAVFLKRCAMAGEPEVPCQMLIVKKNSSKLQHTLAYLYN